MSGSDASISGYGNIFPNSNVNGSYVNVTSSNYSGGLSSNEIPKSSLVAIKNNAEAANASIMKGGRRKYLSRKYKKMKKSYKRSRRGGKRRSLSKRNKRSRRTMKGGYSQYQNNMPLTPVYSLGSNDNNSALANPPPVNVLSGCANCSDNYNHFLRTSFASKGWGAQ